MWTKDLILVWQMHVMYKGCSRGADEGGGYVDRWPPPSLSPYFFLLSFNSPHFFSPLILSSQFPFLPSLLLIPFVPSCSHSSHRHLQGEGHRTVGWTCRDPPYSLLYLPDLGNSGKTTACDARSTWVQIPTLPLASCVTSGKWLTVSELQFLHL